MSAFRLFDGEEITLGQAMDVRTRELVVRRIWTAQERYRSRKSPQIEVPVELQAMCEQATRA